jgi:hypothetical protein
VTSHLVCRPEQDLPVALLNVSGVLDPVTGDALRRAVSRSLAARPHALVIDVAGMTVGAPGGVGALHDVVGRTSEWPGVPIVLCGADRATRRALDADDRAVAYAETRAAAIASVGEEPAPHPVRARLRPVPDACRQARQLVSQVSAGWHRTEIAAVATLVATELVANVVRHAHTTMEFTMGLRDGRIWLAVRDGSLRLPRPADPSLAEPGGRGLRLIRELSEAWGVLPFSDGKVVWTRLLTA